MATFQAAASVAMAHGVGPGRNDCKIELAERTRSRTLAHAAEAG
jgi:hypothetical protein